MAVVAITGELASGKSSVLRLLRRKGAHIFSADKNIHRLYRDKKSSVYKKIAKLFPDVLIGRKAMISRKKLGEIVFSNADKLRRLERIIHPAVIAELLRWVAFANKKKAIYVAEVPLLFEKNLQGYFDYIVLVTARQDILIKRIRQKYKLSSAAALRRLRLFLPTAKKREMVDFVIDNSSNMNRLQKEVESLWKKLKQRQRSITIN